MQREKNRNKDQNLNNQVFVGRTKGKYVSSRLTKKHEWGEI